MLSDELENLGLSEKEAQIYLATLELATDTVQNIAKKAKVKRVTTYVILKSLMKKGLASTVEKAKKTYFVAEEPDRLIRFLDQQIKNLNEKKDTIKPLLSELKLINNIRADKPTVRFFEGKEGVDAMMDEFIKEYQKGNKINPDEVLYLAYSKDKIDSIFPKEQIERSRSKRVQSKIPVVALYNWKGTDSNFKLSTSIKLPTDAFPFPCDIAVYGNKIRLISLSETPTAILITDTNLADGLRSLFKLGYMAAKTIR